MLVVIYHTQQLSRSYKLSVPKSSDGSLTVRSLIVSAKQSSNCACLVLRTGLVTGKLSQVNQTFHVIRATARTFERAQWEALEKRLVAWKTGLVSVRDVIASAKRRNAPAEPPATNNTDAAASQTHTVAA